MSSQNISSIGASVTGPMVFFKDAFFIIPLKYSNLDSTTRVDGDGIALKAKDLIDNGKIDEAKSYLFENVPGDFAFRISDLDLFTLK